ncbi:MAG: DNA-binding protein, partial [Bacteroides oleiciplenus]|nr:DNA-binding protein [Bacteroides oleiciplenus]MBD9093970.1 DNA-binding protein [Bacteroides oleiciplenus]
LEGKPDSGEDKPSGGGGSGEGGLEEDPLG